MKELQVPLFPKAEAPPSFNQISKFLDSLKPENIETAPWQEYPYKPEVSFSIAHNGSFIFLKYYVAEIETRAVYTQINQPVYKDSCVEFFIAFDNEPQYYNLEFNSVGTCTAGFGSGKEARSLLPKDVISKIKFETFSRLTDDQNNYWELCLSIPVTVFCHHHISNLEGLLGKANFYKCGDDLAQPHFLAWNTIKSKEPNFHLPEFFGGIAFSGKTVLT